MKNKNIVLASASPRRISLLKEWGLDFEVVPSRVDENTKLIKPSYIVRDLSLRKGSDVALKRPCRLILAADTIVVLNGKIVGKPKDEKDSETIL